MHPIINISKVFGISLAVLLTACASQPERMAELEQAQAEVAEARQNAVARRVATRELNNAEEALAAAQQAWESNEDPELIRHEAYMATRYAEIVQERAAQAELQEQIESSSAKRSDILLSARSNQVKSLSAELAALKAKDTKRGLVLTLGDVLFATDKAELQPGAQKTVSRLAEFMQDNPERRLIIEGHTDSTGSDDYNENLSFRRANTVATALVHQGIARDRLTVKGLGELYPVASNESSAGRQENRRVEIVVSSEDGSFPRAATR